MRKSRSNRVVRLFSDNNDKKAILVKSPSFITYLVGICFPYPDQSPFSVALVASADDSHYTLIVPEEWTGILEQNNWAGRSQVYSVNDGGPKQAFLHTVSKTLESYSCTETKVMFDYSSWNVSEIAFLKENFPNIEICDCDSDLNRARTIKTNEEIANIKTAAIIADRGLIGALNHLEGTLTQTYYTRSEFLERVRVHAIEFGANCVGDLNLSEGKLGRNWYTPITDASLVEVGDSLRVNYSVSINGYWGVCNRQVYAGKLDSDDLAAYEANQMLKQYAVSLLKSGVCISEFCDQIMQKAVEQQITVLADEGFGHGVGTSEDEMPFITQDNTDKFEEGMVISLEVKTLGKDNEIILDGDIYLLKANGCEKLSDFVSWETPYAVVGVRANH